MRSSDFYMSRKWISNIIDKRELLSCVLELFGWKRLLNVKQIIACYIL